MLRPRIGVEVGMDGMVGFVVDGRDDLRRAARKGICLVVEDAVDDAAVGHSLWIWLDGIRTDRQVIVHLASQDLADVLVDWIYWSHRLVLLVVLQE